MSEPIAPTNALVLAINSQLGDRHFRDSLRQMSYERYPLLKMLEDLGLEDDASPALRKIIDNLPPEIVDGIRRATLDMLDRDERAMPVKWGVTDAELDRGAEVDVEIVETEHGRVIEIRPVGRVGPR